MPINEYIQEIKDEELFNNHKGKMWSTAVEKAMTAPFPDVAMQYLLVKVYDKALKDSIEVIKSHTIRDWSGEGEVYGEIDDIVEKVKLLSIIKQENE